MASIWISDSRPSILASGCSGWSSPVAIASPSALSSTAGRRNAMLSRRTNGSRWPARASTCISSATVCNSDASACRRAICLAGHSWSVAPSAWSAPVCPCPNTAAIVRW